VYIPVGKTRLSLYFYQISMEETPPSLNNATRSNQFNAREGENKPKQKGRWLQNLVNTPFSLQNEK